MPRFDVTLTITLEAPNAALADAYVCRHIEKLPKVQDIYDVKVVPTQVNSQGL